MKTMCACVLCVCRLSWFYVLPSSCFRETGEFSVLWITKYNHLHKHLPSSKLTVSLHLTPYNLFEDCFDSGYQYQFGERYHPGGDACSICECGLLCIYGYNGCPESNATVKGTHRLWFVLLRSMSENMSYFYCFRKKRKTESMLSVLIKRFSDSK